jgi:TRAP-type C4-dicarboxylate transport system permease small subunit
VRAWLAPTAEAIGVAIFAAMFGAFLLQVLFRYVLGSPLGWTDELSLVLYAWAVFWACAFAVPWREHVSFDLLYQVAPPHARRAFALIGAGLVAGLFVAALPATLDYVAFMARSRTPVLGWRYDWVFACFPIFLAAVAARAVHRIATLLRSGWEERIGAGSE